MVNKQDGVNTSVSVKSAVNTVKTADQTHVFLLSHGSVVVLQQSRRDPDQLSPVRTAAPSETSTGGSVRCVSGLPVGVAVLCAVLDAAVDAVLQSRAPPGGRGGVTSPSITVRAP